MSAADFDVRPIRGAYRVRKEGGRRGGGPQHQSFHAAEREALRLADADASATFVITQEVARVTRARPVRTSHDRRSDQ